MSRHVLETAADVPATGPLAEALAVRGRLMELTQASHDAALLPEEPGGLSHALRAALAARIARLNGDVALAAHYTALAGDTGEAALADPEAFGNDTRISAILSYVDRVTTAPKDATRADIEMLRAAGIAEGDIVRLAGLVAFVNYQVRVALVLRKLGNTE
ncbi:hypothetical protein [Pararhodobacter sp. SW119]|uniref:CMD domain-containing protein n=1 Tax=Pararhodobacter sp. SW119 TaxID=2780075 RepID=UPI001ADF401C|nr:hypothetical protein [Pararhodobacter sp. SW119]